jgi:YVTN family beta-propeller protein
MRTIPLVAALAACGTEPDPRADLQIPPPSAAYHLFEAGPVRPVTLTPSGTRLVVTNQPDNRIEIFDVDGAGDLTHAGSVVVGMVPVAVAARTDDEVWVVNHLSDSVSIVDLSLGTVTETLRVGDEPRDIVFARGQAFIATAHRGQALTDPALAGVPGAGDPQLTTPGVGRADVWVFDTAAPSVPVEIVNLFGDTPRALATNGSLVYAAVLHSGNQTTVVHENVVCNPGSLNAQGTCAGDGITSPGGLAGGRLPGRMLPPFTDDFGVAAPEVSVIVQYDAPTGTWLDQAGRNWSNGVRFDLPDSDVFAIRASDRQVLGAVSGVGTTLFNLAVDPVRGDVYVSNTEANNLDRLEGHAIPGRDTLRGELSKARITRITPRGTVVPHPLNGHIDYASPVDVPGEARHSLAIPLQMAFSPSADTVYVAAYGSARVGVVSTADLRAGTFDPTAASADYIELTGGGPGGLALSADGARLYTYNRFDNSVSVVDVSAH